MYTTKTLPKESTPKSIQPHSIPRPEKHGYDLVVFCHLRWDFVYQRPQHIISRLSHDYKILFVEEPWQSKEIAHSLNFVLPNLHVFRPNISHIDELAGVLTQLLGSASIPLAWFYSPSFCTVLDQMKFGTVIYDCMDELSLFKGAPASLIQQERDLLEKSDIVFTGGRSLYEAKTPHHPNVHCFPSSVDFDHFARAKNGINLPHDIIDIPSPIVGYFGVVDERLDLELIEQTAAQLPEVSFVFIGPVVKISDSDLPRLPNIYYLGMKAYQTLPNYLKAFNIAMMPFALNDATKYISPTKTLEYMAAGKPIISTRVKDVEREYSTSVHLVSNAAEFAEEIKSILFPSTANSTHVDRYSDILGKTSWNSTVFRMKVAIRELSIK
jgi:glycosyltransferase involved in cell wall biosynthesis